MKNKFILLYASLLASLCFACKSPYPGLRKLSYQELYTRAKNIVIEPDLDRIQIFDKQKRALSLSELNRFSRDSFSLDKYVDSSDSVRLWVVRPIRKKDIQLREKIKGFYDNDVNYRIQYIKLTVKDTVLRNNMLSMVYLTMPIKPVNINCDSAQIILKQVAISDQDNRSGGHMDNMVDRENQIKVVSIIERCGFPAYSAENEESIYAMFLVVQHAGPELREKYFPLFKKAAAKGVFQKSALALMEDRMLTDQHKKQKYGTQVRMEGNSGKHELYPIEDIENIDKRRAEMDLGPIQDYLNKFNINWAEYLARQKDEKK